MKINLDKVLKLQQTQYNGNQEGGDSLRELKHEDGPLLTFDKKRREAGNRHQQESVSDSQNKSTCRFGETARQSKHKTKKKQHVKTYREVRKGKKSSRKVINAAETVRKREMRNQTTSPFGKRVKLEKKKLEKMKM